MASNWNAFLDRALSEQLTVAEMRLYLAIGRCVLGWNKTDAALGEALLRQTAGLHGRTFTRARGSLVDRGLITWQRGRPGPGGRAVYGLMLKRLEFPALERAIETPAAERETASGNTRSQVQETPADERG